MDLIRQKSVRELEPAVLSSSALSLYLSSSLSATCSTTARTTTAAEFVPRFALLGSCALVVPESERERGGGDGATGPRWAPVQTLFPKLPMP